MKKVFTSLLLAVLCGAVLFACDGGSDTTPPVFSGTKDISYVIGDEKPDYLGHVRANDNVDGNITNKIEIDESAIDYTKEGSYDLIYKVSDAAGNEATKTVKVNVSSTAESGLLPDDFVNDIGDKHVYLTTIGQGGEFSTVKNIIQKRVYSSATADQEAYAAKVTENNVLAADSVPNGAVVIVVPTYSSKGMGSASVSKDSELARANAFKDRAAAGEITLYVVHIGGESRRGADSDPIISAVSTNAKLILVEKHDSAQEFFGAFTNASVFYYDAAIDMVGPFKQLFNKQ